jgi:hypothetical protein
MVDKEFFYASEVNDLTLVGKRKKKKSYKKSENGDSNSGSSEVSATQTATSVGATAVSTVVPVVIAITAVTLLVVSVVQLTSDGPVVSVTEWKITCDSVGFLLDADESDTPYVITLDQSNQVVESREVTDSNGVVEFDGLSPSTEYTITIENDWGEGILPIIEYSFSTLDTPTFPNGRLIIRSSHIDLVAKTVTLEWTLNDPYGYLGAFRLEMTDGVNLLSQTIRDVTVPFVVDIHSLERGFLDVTIYGRSSHPTIGGEETLLTRYEIFY